jgi:flagellar biosynthesis anti-sigma factor FlgM
MKVDLTSFGVEPPERSTTGRAGQTGASGTGASSAAGVDQTRFSFDQTRVQSLEAQVLAQPEIRQAKIEPLQQAIGNGAYSVPASQIADALASELGGAQS